MPVLAALGLYAKAGLSGLWGFLKGASAWQILCLAMGALLIVQHFQLVSARHSAAKWEALSVNYRRQIDAADTQARQAEQQSKQIAKELKDRTDEETTLFHFR